MLLFAVITLDVGFLRPDLEDTGVSVYWLHCAA